MSTSSAPQSDNDEFTRAQQAAEFILSRTSARPRIALVLGSGLGGFADDLDSATRIPYAEIPSFPHSTAVGHAGNLVIGSVEDVAVAAMQGRVHLYEGYSAQEVAFPMRVFACMGIKAAILTNAAGGINPSFGRGALVVIRDHINLQGQNPLTGPNDERFGPRFPDMTDAYNLQFRNIALAEAASLGGEIYEGVYAALAGPSYETPAEIRYLRTIGADLVGMSTVPEVIAARHMNMNVLAISCVTNKAAGMSGEKIDHEEVLETGERVSGKLLALLRAVLPKIDRYLDSQSIH
jgi:purine-nucleoside phosphorylase